MALRFAQRSKQKRQWQISTSEAQCCDKKEVRWCLFSATAGVVLRMGGNSPSSACAPGFGAQVGCGALALHHRQPLALGMLEAGGCAPILLQLQWRRGSAAAEGEGAEAHQEMESHLGKGKIFPSPLLPTERRGSDIASLIHENHSELLYW